MILPRLCAIPGAVLGAVLWLPTCHAADSSGSPVESAVVKIFSTTRYPDVFRPWTKQPASEITGSGVVIEGHRILTNAHVVLYAGEVQVQASQSGDKVSATVEAIAPGIDLAVLRLDDESFFETHHPLARDHRLPDVKDPVLAYGFPTGGTNLSITKGIVSRIEFTGYNIPTSGLRIQIDAAINPGNSGGPAVVGDKMIGLAFSYLGNAQNIGYIIPNEEIELFLNSIVKGTYRGKPAIFEETQNLQNPSVRSFLKLPKDVRGVFVHKPFEGASGYPLKRWDVITRIGNAPVDDEGMVEIGATLRVRYEYMVQKLERNGAVQVTVWREGREIPIELPVMVDRPSLVPDLKGAYPPYFIFGPIVFSEDTTQFNAGITKDSLEGLMVSGSRLASRRGDDQSFPGERLVIVSSPFFPSKLADAYSRPLGWVLSDVNGIPVRNLAHLVAILRDLKSEYVTFDFHGNGYEAFVFPRKATLAATDDILNDNGIRSQGSPDMMQIWQAKPSK